MGAGLGSLVGLPVSGWLVFRFGTARTVLAGASLCALGLAAAGLAVDLLGSRALTTAALAVGGLGIGVWDVSMNLEGAALERRLRRSIMPRLHAAFSAGTVGSGLLGAALTWRGIPVAVHLAVTAAVCLGVARWATGRFLPSGVERQSDSGSSTFPDDSAHPQRPGHPEAAPGPGMRAAWTELRTVLIGVVTLVAALTEGVADDWLAVAFVDGHGHPAWVGVLGFATFLAAMTVGRVLGTGWLDRYGRVAVLRVTFLLAGAGALLVVFGGPGPAFAGAALWGIGASLGFPVGMSAAADDPARAPARVSVVSTIGYAAFLAGPPLVGLLGDHLGVLRALAVVGAAALLGLLAVPAVREARPPGS